MSDEIQLKEISRAHIPGAIAKAEHYRLLNQPEEAESICLDVLAVDADNQQALAVIVLAITDQFLTGQVARRRAVEFLRKLEDDYLRAYYGGLIAEREARSFLHRKLPGAFAYASLREAMELYLEADGLTAEEDDDALLRYNFCVRTLQKHELRPEEESSELPLE